MPELSPVELLQERYRSAADEYPDPDGLAAALEALADQVVPPESLRLDNCCDHRSLGHRHQILTIAAELRGETTITEPQP